MGMEWYQVAATVAVLVGIFVGLVRNHPADALLLGGLVVLGVIGVISPAEAFAGFANHGMLTVAALYIVAAGLKETGALAVLGRWLLGGARTEGAVFARMALCVPGCSAFLNNTPIVAMFIPIITDWCKGHQKASSRLLIPLSFLSILGGTCTLIGTSTNLVVNGLMVEKFNEDPVAHAHLEGMGLFEMSWVGIPYAIVGIAFLWLFGRRLLPDRKAFMQRMHEQMREYLVNLQIRNGCPLVNATVSDAGLRHLQGLFLIEINRDGEVIAPVEPNMVMREGDVLTFTGAAHHIVDLERIPGLVPVGDEGYLTRAADKREAMMVEAVVSNRSPVLGMTIRDSNFRAMYNAAVVAVNRGGERLGGRVGDIVLRNGDTLLLQTGPHFVSAHRDDPAFYLVSGMEDSRPTRDDKGLLALGLLVALVVMMATGVVSIVLAAFLVAGLMIATRCISIQDARKSLDLSTLLTICAAFGIGTALENSGVAGACAEGLIALGGPFGPYVMLAGVYLMTAIFTEVVTNNAAAALTFPFAIAIAEQMGVNPRPFALAVAFAASASFITPLGYQTNLMVFGPGGYRFVDFVRIGTPLSIVLLIMATILIPMMWPF
jgi:di/tricarboxylate transporter